MTEAVIIGGGIAGTAMALALHKAGIGARVFEAYPSGGDDAGALLTVGANGMLALHQIDAAETVAAAGFPLHTVEILGDGGTSLGRMPLRQPHDGVPGHHHMRRAALYRALQDEATRRGIEVRHGKRLRTAGVRGDGVRAEFTDGDAATGDLLIGADGVHSTVRPLIDADAPTPRFTGERVLYGYLDTAPVPAEPDVITMFRVGKVAFGFTVSPGGETWWFARVQDQQLTRAELDTTGIAAWRGYLLGELGDDGPAATIVAATGAELLAANTYDLRDAPHWSAGPMVVIGDAAHAASPASAQGASMAAEDAVMLAKSLRDNDSLPEAFAIYDRLRRVRVNRIIDGGAAQASARPESEGARRERLNTSRRDQQQWLHDYPLDWQVIADATLAEQVAREQQP